MAEDTSILGKEGKQVEGPQAKKSKRGLAARSVNSQPVKDFKPLAAKAKMQKPASGDAALALQEPKKTHSDQTNATESEQPAAHRQNPVPKRSLVSDCAVPAMKRADALAGQTHSLRVFHEVPAQIQQTKIIS